MKIATLRRNFGWSLGSSMADGETVLLVVLEGRTFFQYLQSQSDALTKVLVFFFWLEAVETDYQLIVT